MPTVKISANTGADFGGVLDTRIVPGAPTTNFSTGTTIEVDSGGGNSTLILFPTSGISGPVTVTAATLRFAQTFNQGAAGSCPIDRVLVSWTNAGVTWGTRDGSTAWGTAGALGAGDISNIGTASFDWTFPPDTLKPFTSIDLIATVEGWINGTFSNHGLRVGTTTSGMTFHSSEGATDGLRPELEVTYTVNATTASIAWVRA